MPVLCDIFQSTLINTSYSFLRNFRVNSKIPRTKNKGSSADLAAGCDVIPGNGVSILRLPVQVLHCRQGRCPRLHLKSFMLE